MHIHSSIFSDVKRIEISYMGLRSDDLQKHIVRFQTATGRMIKGGAIVMIIAGLRLDTESRTETNSDEPMH